MLHLPVSPDAKTGGCWLACNTNANQFSPASEIRDQWANFRLTNAQISGQKKSPRFLVGIYQQKTQLKFILQKVSSC